MTKLETDQSLLDSLKAATSRQLSAEEAWRQRVSFVMASLSEHNDMTREQVQVAIREKEGQAIAR